MKSKRESFSEARQRLSAELVKSGWRYATADARGNPLKFPHATSPDGLTRLYFKPQAIVADHVGYHSAVPLSMNNARSVTDDMRGLDVGLLLARASKVGF